MASKYCHGACATVSSFLFSRWHIGECKGDVISTVRKKTKRADMRLLDVHWMAKVILSSFVIYDHAEAIILYGVL